GLSSAWRPHSMSSSSIVYFLRRTKRAASATFDHIDFKPASLSVYVCVPNARWLLRSPGPYLVRAVNERNVPIRRGDSGHPLFRELAEPTDQLDIEPCPTRKVLGALGALCIAHGDWTSGAAMPFGKFLFRPAHVLAHGGRLAV